MSEPEEWTTPPLTFEENEVVNMLGDAFNIFSRAIVANGAMYDHDVNEFAGFIHGAQRMVLSQAAARCYPDSYRLLGKVGPPAKTEP